MFFLYDLLVRLATFGIRLAANFSPKLRLFVDGRTKVFQKLSAEIKPSDKTIWFHAASLGEFEQGLPLMELFRTRYPDHKIIVTFFSPSGYEVRKNNTVADCTVYLPMDTASNARKFLDIVHPELVFFIKYEYWPNYLNQLRKRNIRSFLVSGIFRDNQVFFKWYGGFYRKALQAFEHFFVQNAASKELLARIEKFNATVSGDTRFDRVATILKKDNSLDFMAGFKDDKPLLVAGSSWPEDEFLLTQYINQSRDGLKFLFAPHNIKATQIAELRDSLKKTTVLWSEREGKTLSEYEVMIVDTVGLLTKIYSYADIAYVGGGFGKPGVHNILEPATFGVPVVIGPTYDHFAEAVALVDLQGCTVIHNEAELEQELDRLFKQRPEREKQGGICREFVQENKGAVTTISTYFDEHPL